jgi:diaminopimelate decarboxylase
MPRRSSASAVDHPHLDTDCLSVRGGRLFIEELDTVELAERFGTPLFVLSETQLRDNVRRFQRAFAAVWGEGPVDVLPAFKANTNLATRHVLTEEGAGADIYSSEELHGVLRTAVEPARVSVNGGGKPDEHLRDCVAAGVRITVEDVDEVDRIERVAAELNATAKIRLRVKPAMPNLWRRTDFSQLSVPIDLGLQVYKSGIPAEHLVDLGRRALAAEHVELVGLHFHAGRHHPSLWYWQGLMTRYGRLIGELCHAWGGWQPQEIDIGGGWPSPRDPHNLQLPRSEFLLTALGYPFLVGLRGLGERAYHAALGRLVPALTSHTERDAPPAIEDFAATAVGALRGELDRAGVDTAGVRLQVEPGRSLYGDAGIHLARVKRVKHQSRPIPYAWVLTDTTQFFLAGGVFEHNRHPYVAAGKADQQATMRADLVGHSCFADQLVLGAELPEVVEGDVIAILETGAYQESSASNFNALPRPATVLVAGDQAEIVKRAETVDDVYGRDVVPERLDRTGVGPEPRASVR